MEEKIYPLDILVVGDIGNGMALSTKKENTLLDSFGAVKIRITINSHDYPKKEVREAIREIALKAVECYF